MAPSRILLNDGEPVVLATRPHAPASFGPLLAPVVLLAVGLRAPAWPDELPDTRAAAARDDGA